jgi:segregation and condensation protein B
VKNLTAHIESLIFTSPSPISSKDLHKSIEEIAGNKVSVKEVDESIKSLEDKFKSNNYSFGIVKINNGYQFLTKAEFHETVRVLNRQKANKKLSTAAMETLAIIAYKQPITKLEMEHIRGVNCDYSVQKLLEKELVEIKGKKEAPGRPLLYGVSDKFMEYFALDTLDQLPQIKDLHMRDVNEIGIETEDQEPNKPTTNQDGPSFED